MSVECDTNNSQFIYPPQGCGLQDDDLTLTTTFETLKAACVEMEATQIHGHDWVSDHMWLLIKQCTPLCQAVQLCCCIGVNASHPTRYTCCAKGGSDSANGSGSAR